MTEIENRNSAERPDASTMFSRAYLLGVITFDEYKLVLTAHNQRRQDQVFHIESTFAKSTSTPDAVAINAILRKIEEFGKLQPGTYDEDVAVSNK